VIAPVPLLPPLASLPRRQPLLLVSRTLPQALSAPRIFAWTCQKASVLGCGSDDVKDYVGCTHCHQARRPAGAGGLPGHLSVAGDWHPRLLEHNVHAFARHNLDNFLSAPPQGYQLIDTIFSVPTDPHPALGCQACRPQADYDPVNPSWNSNCTGAGGHMLTCNPGDQVCKGCPKGFYLGEHRVAGLVSTLGSLTATVSGQVSWQARCGPL
jgi:hypothetical protein